MTDRYDLLTWYAQPSEEERRNEERWGVKQPPTVLGYGITLEDNELVVDVLTIIRPIRAGRKRVTLHRADGTRRTVSVAWREPLRVARWGDADFRLE